MQLIVPSPAMTSELVDQWGELTADTGV